MISLQKTISIFLSCCLSISLLGQSIQAGDVWQAISEFLIPQSGARHIKPTHYQTFKLKTDALQSILDIAAMEGSTIAHNTQTLLPLPMPDGSIEWFNINESPIMAPELGEKYPDIQTYKGVSISDPGKYLRFDLTPAGFHAMVLVAGGSTIFIDPYSFGGGDTEHYIVYYRKDFRPAADKGFACQAEFDMDDYKRNPAAADSGLKAFGTCERREYRLALACTGEYAQFHGGTVAGALAAQVTTMNRVNGIYERDMAIRMIIIPNNDTLIFLNASTDPYSNNNVFLMLGQNQTTCDNRIGSANYDIGHVFGTGGGGVAGLGVVCTNGSKAEGVTGSNSPQGDPFDIDYVAHEMGHQFAADHTQNNSSCANPPVNVEPGSASTIMGYAGICSPNVQNNSDDYFNGANLQQIGNFITAVAHSCPNKVTLTNNAPTVTVAQTTYTIPASTPFALTAVGNDPDAGDVLTYCWEQRDNQTITHPPQSTATGGPVFRSLPPTTNPTRYFPNLTALAAGGPFTWEVLPSVSRTMNFRVMVRDNALGGGCNDHADVVVNVSASAGPFVVLYPSATGISWIATTNQTVTWDLANTDIAPVNSPTVDIYLSTDGGQSYPTVLATNVPNTGSHLISVPNTPSNTCRIMVRSHSGLFFDISDNNFAITAASFGYTMGVNTPTQGACASGTVDFDINIGSLLGYSDAVTLSLSGLPAGASSNFSSNPVNPGNSTTLSVGNLGAVSPGSYPFTVNANSTSGPQTLNLVLEIYANSLSAVSLNPPANNGSAGSPASFTWTASSSPGVTYSIEVATDSLFNNIVHSMQGLNTNSYNLSGLADNTIHYWRIYTVNPCTTSPASSVFSFSTPYCFTHVSTNVPIVIPASGTPTITSIIDVQQTGIILDVDVLNLAGTHTWISDLTVRLTSPQGTTRTLWDDICDNEDNFNVNFDDDAAPGPLPCPPVGGGFYQPEQSLSAFNGQSQTGIWTLTIVDNFNLDGGNLNSWSLRICVPASLPSQIIETEALVENFLVIPNPNQGQFTVVADLGQAQAASISIVSVLGQTLRQYQTEQASIRLQVDLQQFSSGVYFVVLQTANGTATQKVSVLR